MEAEVTNIVEAIITGQPMDPDRVDELSRFIQAAQPKFDLGLLAIGAHHLRRYGKAAKLMDLLEQILLPSVEMTLEEFRERITPQMAIDLLPLVQSNLMTSFKVIQSMAKQPTASSPETMARNLNGAEVVTSVGAQNVGRISPERRQQLRNIVEILAEKAVVKVEPRSQAPAGMIKKRLT